MAFLCWSLFRADIAGGFLLHSDTKSVSTSTGLEMVNEDYSESRRYTINLIASTVALSPSLVVSASAGTTSSSSPPMIQVDLDCLKDLPPIPADSVRIYLCRHGQTENNRLRKVQGSRVNPPINDNGIQQATALGKALSRASTGPPLVVYHSKLKRAQMTAEIASRQISDKIKPAILESLGEVDFGSVADGIPVALAKAGFAMTFAAWVSQSTNKQKSSFS
jgi:hypothetical protein